MKLKILLTSTSFIDTPGNHHKLLNEINSEIIKKRGPLTESELLPIISSFDALICGDDELTSKVILKGVEGKLKFVSKYGTGLDKIDTKTLDKLNIPYRNCPGINQTTVAEHVFALLLSFSKNIVEEINSTRNNKWDRLIGTELKNKTIGVIGTGNVGKEVIKIASAFQMKILAYDKFMNTKFCNKYDFTYCEKFSELLQNSDILSLNISLNDETKNILNMDSVKHLKKGVIIVNTSRDGLIDHKSLIYGIESGIIQAYLTDVLEKEPMVENHHFLKYKNIFITPHIGSRTYENVVNQGSTAVKNLIDMINKYK